MKTKILIVDDETLARTRIHTYLDKFPEKYEVREAQDGFAALELIPDYRPDILFLDIEMPELNGFDVLMHIIDKMDQLPIKVIFQTAYDEFAIKAFEVNACDYLLKPFDDERLQQSLDRALASISNSPSLKNLAVHLTSEKKYLGQFVVNVGNKNRIIDSKEVIYMLSESHITRIFLENVDYAYDHSLSYLEEHLDPNVFLRIHRNCIIRLDTITTYSHGPNMEVTLSNGITLKASREGAKALKQALEGEKGD